MDNIEDRSLAELETHYQQKLDHWTRRREKLLEQVRECEQQTALYDQKLRYVRALVNGPEAAAAAPPPPRTGSRRAARRRSRKSPIRDATIQVLRDRPGQKLTVAQIRTLIRKDTNRRASRQSVNANVDILEQAGLVKRERAPRGCGARFVVWAV